MGDELNDRKNFERIPRSDREQELIDLAAALLPACARTATMSLESAMVIREGHGSRIVDLSGNEYRARNRRCHLPVLTSPTVPILITIVI